MDEDIDSEELTTSSDVDSSDVSDDEASSSPASQEEYNPGKPAEEYNPGKRAEPVTKPLRTKAGNLRKRGVRCMECPACLRQDDCGRCEFCKDKRKFGGPAVKKQACM